MNKINGMVLPEDQKDIVKLLKAGGALNAKSIEFADDGIIIDVAHNGKFKILPEMLDENGVLKFKFKKIIADIVAKDIGLMSLDNFPRNIIGSLDISANPIESFETKQGPISIGNILNANFTHIESLEDINNNISQVSMFYFSKKIKSGGLGLITIPELHTITNTSPAFKIIAKYLGKPDDIFDCQNELIEAGFEEYAKL